MWFILEGVELFSLHTLEVAPCKLSFKHIAKKHTYFWQGFFETCIDTRQGFDTYNSSRTLIIHHSNLKDCQNPKFS